MRQPGFRPFLDLLLETGELKAVTAAVDARHELGQVVRENFRRHGPAIKFEAVSGHRMPLVSGTLATRRRIALALGVGEDELTRTLSEARKPVPARRAASGPCKEVVVSRDKLDLNAFPSPVWHEEDAGPYLGTLASCVTVDAHTGVRNVGIYRAMVRDARTFSVEFPPHKDIARHIKQYEARDERMPLALAIGVDPVLTLLSSAPLPYDEDEYEAWGALRGEPLEVVPCETNALEVPADAEIVVEARALLGRREPEGPFGEHTGYYSAETRMPIFEVTGITHRETPIFHGTDEGRPPNESATLRAVGRGAMMFRALRGMGLPGVVDVAVLPEGGANYIVVIAATPAYPGHVRQLIHAACTQEPLGAKWIIVVDGDVNPHDWEEVTWCLWSRAQPQRDLFTTSDREVGNYLDPSVDPARRGYTSKVGIDATTAFKGFDFPPLAEPSAALKERVLRRWPEYGLP